ncbi:alpha/beta-hydrolase [Coemansia reversa NRRL 1564]|uniref:Carboxypeptidase n=1 Tax=Coemansia reversa (strain ATCC 12441 / NRRL 1564) TaxID=763665 RepID=A0A2G5BE08_COERN|nr:alpha/beta-hydrolase [Coemansia reversa NRRL 1564]|eukprot:PIA17245.1 alpha/beta-hydrolase [Coemansia reversa NRRL 1564]
MVVFLVGAQQASARLRISTENTQNLFVRDSIESIRASETCSSSIFKDNTVNPPPMRLKQPTLCDPEVRQISGYIDLDNKHVFFWYFGSRTRTSNKFNATSDNVPLVFWFSGGPGCSSQIANWQENGPCTVGRNPYAWNGIADIVFIDQPVGAGFSYGPMPNSTEQATDTAWRSMQAIYALLSNQARNNSEAAINNVYVFGESYAGRYIPVFTEYMVHMNEIIEASTQLQARGFLTIPLSGIGIGNGLYDQKLQASSYYTMGCHSTYPALFSAKRCFVVGMRLPNDCIDLEAEPWRSTAQCAYADSYCNGALNWTTMISNYDVRPGARMVPDDYVDYLRTTEFKQAVGARDEIDFVECSDPLFERFSSTNDAVSRSAVASLEFLLARNISVLLYSGDADFICNWYGTMDVVRALNWKGKGRLAETSPRNWSWPTQSGLDIAAGQFIAVDNLAFLRIYEAGHEVPFYQPQASLYMLAQFLDRHTLY